MLYLSTVNLNLPNNRKWMLLIKTQQEKLYKAQNKSNNQWIISRIYNYKYNIIKWWLPNSNNSIVKWYVKCRISNCRNSNNSSSYSFSSNKWNKKIYRFQKRKLKNRAIVMIVLHHQVPLVILSDINHYYEEIL